MQPMRRTFRLQRIVAFLPLLVACAGDQSVRWTGSIDTLPSGTIHVSNPELGLWGNRPVWQLEEVAKIGTRLDSGPELFGHITDIDADAAGRVYVFDWQAQEVRVFEVDGSYVRTIGRPGHGPGEFVANGIEIDPVNRLWVFNQGNMRYSVYDSSGLLLMEPRRLVGNVRFAMWTSVFSPAGDLYEMALSRTPEGHFGGLARYDTLTQRLVDTMPAPEYPDDTKFGTTARTLTAGGWWQGIKLEYRLSHISYVGDTLRIIERTIGAERLSASERDSAEQYEREMRRRIVRGEFNVETERRPIFELLVLDDTDHLWVILSNERGEDSTRFDVFDPVGRYLGEVQIAGRVDDMVLPIIRTGRLYCVVKDELDVPYVVIAEISKRD